MGRTKVQGRVLFRLQVLLCVAGLWSRFIQVSLLWSQVSLSPSASYPQSPMLPFLSFPTYLRLSLTSSPVVRLVPSHLSDRPSSPGLVSPLIKLPFVETNLSFRGINSTNVLDCTIPTFPCLPTHVMFFNCFDYNKWLIIFLRSIPAFKVANLGSLPLIFVKFLN